MNARNRHDQAVRGVFKGPVNAALVSTANKSRARLWQPVFIVTFVTRDPARVKQFRATRSSRLTTTNGGYGNFFRYIVSIFFLSLFISFFGFYQNQCEIFLNRCILIYGKQERYPIPENTSLQESSTLAMDETKFNPCQFRNFLISPDTVTVLYIYIRNMSRVQSGGNSWTKRNDTLALLRK